MRVGRCSHLVVATMVSCLSTAGCITEATDPPTWDDGGYFDGLDAGPTRPNTGTPSEPGSGSGSSSSGGGFVGSGVVLTGGGSSSSSSGGLDFGSGLGGSSSGGSSAAFGSSSGSSSGLSSGNGSSSSSSSGGAVFMNFNGDASTGCPAPTGTAPTWSSIWTTDGFSKTCPSCHKQTSSASAAYSWLKQQGEISGTTSPIASEANSVLAIFEGDMPPSGSGISAAAKCAIVDWAAAGAENN